MTRVERCCSVAVLLILASIVSPGAAAQSVASPCDLKPYLPVSKDEAELNQRLDLFVHSACYETLGWAKDLLPQRNTGPWIMGWSYGTHPAIRVYYSPEVVEWMKKPEKSRGTIPDNAIIIKVQFPLPAGTGDTPTSFTVMVRDNQASWDGWYWAYYGKSVSPMKPATAGDTSYPDSMFGNYCVNCHASTDNPEVTFADPANLAGNSPTYTIVNPSMAPPQASPPTAPLGAHEFKAADDETQPDTAAATGPYPPGSPQAQRFLQFMAPGIALGAYANLPGMRWDHTVAGPKPLGPQQFLTSDQCLGCHDATQNNDQPPNMIYPADGNGRNPIDTKTGGPTYNLSPYGEWRTSLMGLAGRDPIFYAQLASERSLHDQKPGLPEKIQNICFRCHGAMGQRQLSIDTNGQKPFLAEMVMQWRKDQPFAKYASLAREGISCNVCHRIAAEGLGKPATFTGQFNLSKPTEVFGPFTEPLTVPMKQAIGITPLFGQHMKSSALCGSCHAIDLPILDAKGNEVGTEFEQTTYLEWLNSDFQNEIVPFGPTVQTCQDCHMPSTFHMPGREPQQLQYRIANIEDSTYPALNGRAPDPEITMQVRKPYARHTLVGLNVYALQIFQQFMPELGIRASDPMSGYWQTVSSFDLTQQAMVDQATNSTATIEIQAAKQNPAKKTLDVRVRVQNQAGHNFPSGVSFRRAFIELKVLDAKGLPLWASGASNDLGIITEGVDGPVLPTEFLEKQQYQPHYRLITSQSQVQIYEELIKNPEGFFTTSFVALAEHVKSNRLQPRGWKPNGPWAKETRPDPRTAEDPDYSNGSGGDSVDYAIPLAGLKGTPASVSATIYYQTIPPYYLRQRFTDSKLPDTYRLMDMTSRLNVSATPVDGWKLSIAAAVKPVS